MPQANVVTSAGNAIWYTDKAEITALGAGVTYQVYAVGLVTPYGNGTTYTSTPVGNIWSESVAVGANTTDERNATVQLMEIVTRHASSSSAALQMYIHTCSMG